MSTPRKRKQSASNNHNDCVNTKILCRDREVQFLRSIFTKPYLMFQNVFVFGHSATGKTYILRSLINEYQVPNIWINCIVVYSQRLLFEAILTHLLKLNRNQSGNSTGPVMCENACQFVHQLKQAFRNETDNIHTTYLVLDKAEKLTEMPPTVLSTLLRLQELTGLNISTILISENSWDRFHFGTHFPEPYIMHFPQYSKDDLLNILVMNCPEGYSKSFYAGYLQVVLNVCFFVTRNLQELQHIAISNFDNYCKPIQENEATEEQRHKLWRNISPHLKTALSTIYLRESSGQTSVSSATSDSEPVNVIANRGNVELPFYSKFLLLASYIASYNLPRFDKQMFVKNHGHIRKRKSIHKNAKRIIPQHERGPKMFPLHRMLSIFYAIIEEEPKPSTLLFSQISSLVCLRLLSPVGNDLDFPKYKCTATLDFTKSIGKTVSFDIMSYLSDFL